MCMFTKCLKLTKRSAVIIIVIIAALMMAAVIMSILPVLIFYLALQDFFVEGIAMTGLKG